MISTIKYAYNLLRSTVRDIHTSSKRSGQWRTVEKHFLETNPVCALCGSKTRLNVHHKKPFHVFPEFELDLNNLITLCMSRKECHLIVGHLNSFKKYNPNIDEDIKKLIQHPEQKDVILKQSLEDYLKIKH